MSSWMGVEPRHLIALVAVRKEGSFRGAANRLGLVQSAVSQRIAQLERHVGMDLVERSRGHSCVDLTDAGATLLRHAEEILAEFDAALADLRTVADERPALRVGTYESVGSLLLPGALRLLAERNRDVRVQLREDTCWENFFPLVASGELDAAFADLPLEPGPFTFRELTSDPSVLVVRADSPLARRPEPPSLVEIGSLPLIAPSWPMLRLITEHFRAAGVEPSFVFRSEINSGVQELVAHGLGAAVMPRLAVNDSDPRIAVIALGDVLPPRRIALYWHRDRRECEAITDFVDALVTACGGEDSEPVAADVSLLEPAA
jgi:DNA-binding transcriptional LysR family regulator